MKRLILPAVAAGLLLTTSAFAAQHDGKPMLLAKDDHHNAGNPGGGGGGPGGSGGHNDHRSFGGMGGNPGGGGGSGGHNDHRSFGGMGGNPGGGGNFNFSVGGHDHHDFGRGGGHDEHGFGIRREGWDHFPREFDRHDYQRNFHAERHFHWGEYHRPGGWYYRRWGYGDILPAFFWGRDYWISDYWMFDLQIPPYGYTWVRYGDDALLINTATGEVLQVEYGVFD